MYEPVVVVAIVWKDLIPVSLEGKGVSKIGFVGADATSHFLGRILWPKYSTVFLNDAHFLADGSPELCSRFIIASMYSNVVH